MGRFIDIDIEGKIYPMCATSNAIRMIAEEYGSFEECFAKLRSDFVTSEQIKAATDLIFRFVSEGAKKKTLLGEVREDGMPYEAIPYDDIGTWLDFHDIPPIIELISKAVFGADYIEVEIEEDPKNEESEVPPATSGSSPGQEY